MSLLSPNAEARLLTIERRLANIEAILIVIQDTVLTLQPPQISQRNSDEFTIGDALDVLVYDALNNVNNVSEAQAQTQRSCSQ